MEVEEIKRIIVAQEEEFKDKFQRTRIIKREVDLDRLRNYISQPNILAILGIRRCGKSILSIQILEGRRFGYINFDDERLLDFGRKDFDKLLQAFYELYGEVEHIILDEPQNIEGWELFVNRLRRTKSVVVTGSNSKLLSSELADKLTGRHIDFLLFPFSFREFLTYNNINFSKEDLYSTKNIALIKKSLTDYLKIGGLPESYVFGRELLIRLTFDILEKDVIRRMKIKKKASFKELAIYLISNSSNEITFSKLKNVFGLKDQHTVKNWIDGLESAYLLKVLGKFSFKLKEQLIATKKVYCLDTGIVNTIAFKLSENFGKLMENLVAVELLRRKSYWYNNWEIFYWKDYQQREVDFVIKEGLNIRQLIQVTYASSRDEIDKREIKALIKASEELKCKDLLVITWDYEDEIEIERKRIIFKPLWKWLLGA